MTRLWLIRHGQTDWNLAGRIQGQADVPLNETGRQQAGDLAIQLAGISIDAVYSSDLSRAHHTAAVIARHLHQPIRLDPRLREIHQGEWEGRQVSELMAPNRKGNHAVRRDPAADRAPGGETLLEVASRIVAAADEICQSHPGGKVLIVSHGLSLAALICHAEGLPLERAYELIPNNCAPQEIYWTVES